MWMPAILIWSDLHPKGSLKILRIKIITETTIKETPNVQHYQPGNGIYKETSGPAT